MAYIPELHYCAFCRKYLGPDNGDGICCDCEDLFCDGCMELECVCACNSRTDTLIEKLDKVSEAEGK